MEKKCSCGEIIKKIRPSRFERTKYCSQSCKYKYRIQPKRPNYKKPATNPSWFKPGVKTRLGSKLSEEAKRKLSEQNKGKHFGKATEFKAGQNKGDNNSKWKGAAVGYDALHRWVRREKGIPLSCMVCGSKRNIQWANKSHEYHRDVNDWISMCVKHHSVYDRGTKGAIRRVFGEK